MSHPPPIVDLSDGWFIRLVRSVAYIILVPLSVFQIYLIGYHLKDLYIPYWESRLNGRKHTFPPYFYKSHGDDFEVFEVEHYAHLILAIIILIYGLPYLYRFRLRRNKFWRASDWPPEDIVQACRGIFGGGSGGNSSGESDRVSDDHADMSRDSFGESPGDHDGKKEQ